MKPPIKKFLLPTKLMEDEYLPSFLYRVSVKNCYRSYRTFNNDVRYYMTTWLGDNLVDPSHPNTYQVISQLCGVPEIELFHHTIHRFSNIFTPVSGEQSSITLSDGSNYNLSDRMSTRRNSRRSNSATFCPHCLKKAAYYRLIWILSATTVCLEHDCLLVDSCEKCGGSLTIQDVVNSCCPNCGFDLRESATVDTHCDPTSTTVQNMLFSWLGINQPENCIPGVTGNTLYRVYYGLSFFLLRLKDKGELYPFPQNDVIEDSRSTWKVSINFKHRLNVSAVQALMNFPYGFHDFIDRFRENRASSVSMGVDNLYWQWIDSQWLAPEFSFIQKAYNDYLVKRVAVASPLIMKSRRFQANPELLNDFEYVSQLSAAKYLGVTSMTLGNFIRDGKIRALPAIDKYHCGVNFADVKVMDSQLKSIVNLTVTAHLVGVNGHVLRQLLKQGLLEETYGKGGERVVTLNSIENLKANLREKTLSRDITDSRDLKPIVDVSASTCIFGISIPQLIQRIMDGKLIAFLDNKVDPLISDLWLPANTYESIYSESLSQLDMVSMDDFCKTVGVKRIVVYKWVKNGLIQVHRKFSTHKCFLQSDVDEFLRCYITTKEASAILEVGVLVVQKWARDGRLKPVSGSEIDGCHEYRYRRTDIEMLRAENRLTAPQMAKVMGISRSQICARIRQGKIHPVSGPGIDGSKHYLFIV